VPTDVIAPGNSSLANASLSAFVKLQQNPDQPMQLSITNKAGEEVYRLNGMTLATYLNVISGVAVTKAGSPGIMGLFERISTNLFLPDGVFSLYSRDVPDPIEDGKPPGKNLYGTHPVFMAQATDDSWFGLYTNLAQAQDWWVKNSASGEINVTSIAVGGLGDLYFFFGEDPNQLVTAYHNLTGKPVLTPQWALGWNQCRWGYHNTSETRAVVEAYRENDLPLDTMWNDIDYLDRYEDFTEDPKYFADLKDLVSELHANDTHYIPILDIGIAERASGYDAYSKGLDLGVYVTAPNGDPFTGRVWPGDTVYPDFFAENTA
jgi:alpha-glucosidase (family GH31 glycosyl hydrolase)